MIRYQVFVMFKNSGVVKDIFIETYGVIMLADWIKWIVNDGCEIVGIKEVSQNV